MRPTAAAKPPPARRHQGVRAAAAAAKRPSVHEGLYEQLQTALKNLGARQLLGIEPNDIMLTCSKDLWNDEPRGRGIKVGSRLYQANWIANTTRGTNAFSHCSHAIYLYDQHLNPAIVRWLNVENRGAFDNDYALSEFIQWLYRSRVRKGEPVTVFFASSRMRSLVENWLYSDA